MNVVLTRITRQSLAFRLAFFVLSTTSLIFIGASGYNYFYSRNALLKDIEEKAANLTLSKVNQIESVLLSVEKNPRLLASYLSRTAIPKEHLLMLVEDIVRTNDAVFGSTAAYEPNTILPDERFFAPYYFRGINGIELMYLGGENYNFFVHDWYQIPKELKKPVWSEPYFDEGGGDIIMSTFSVPFFRDGPNGENVLGIVTADVSLEWLVSIVSSVQLFESGFAFVVSQNGVFVSHPDRELIMRESIFSVAEAHGDSFLREIGLNMVRGKSGFVPYHCTFLNEKCWMYYAPMPTVSWSMGVVIPEDELLEGLRSLTERLVVIGVCGLIILLAAVAFISGTITKPIRKLAKSTAEIAKGNLDVSIPSVVTHDEVGQLAHSFDNMRTALKEYINNLAETTAAKERIESELKIAHSIQMSFLPKQFPPFPDKKEFEIFAMLEPAKEVGGDLYDFFLIDDSHLFLSVGDVAGKGVPAALFMAVTKTLIKGITEVGMAPSDILMRVNDELARGNETSMFVTMFCGILNFKTGRFVYSNAAHNIPLLTRSGSEPRWLDVPRGFLLGPMIGTEYITAEITLQPGDRLFVYTDGVPEAMDAGMNLFSNERLIETIDRVKTQSAEVIAREVMKAVHDFAAGEPQSDDITVLSLHYRGNV